MILHHSAQPTAQHSVILLHGLARNKRSMHKLAQKLAAANYHVVNIDYPSTRHTIQALAQQTIPSALAQCPKHSTIHFVTHSMGGILIRQYLSTYTIRHLGHIIMLSPPNQGSQVVDKLGRLFLFKLINGPAGRQLGTHKQSLPNSLGPATFKLGIITGTRSINPVLSCLLPRPNDGKVSVENSKLPGMSDHIALPVTHTFIMNNNTVIAQVIYFLKNGFFNK